MKLDLWYLFLAYLEVSEVYHYPSQTSYHDRNPEDMLNVSTSQWAWLERTITWVNEPRDWTNPQEACSKSAACTVVIRSKTQISGMEKDIRYRFRFQYRIHCVVLKTTNVCRHPLQEKDSQCCNKSDTSKRKLIRLIAIFEFLGSKGTRIFMPEKGKKGSNWVWR